MSKNNSEYKLNLDPSDPEREIKVSMAELHAIEQLLVSVIDSKNPDEPDSSNEEKNEALWAGYRMVDNLVNRHQGTNIHDPYTGVITHIVRPQSEKHYTKVKS